jgi:hypothetical protein
MQPLTKLTAVSLALFATGIACRSTLPPNGPPKPTADGSPALRTNDAPTGPLADEGLSSPPDNTAGTNSQPIPPLPDKGSGGTGSRAP